ncbi:MAG TPA: S53 family peptidase [Acidimicrobiia bacterium]|nr:S53 family peptidase [Acidimicrobiia bacterium]
MVASVGALTAGVAVGTSGAGASTSRVTLAHSRPAFAASAVDLGAAPANRRVDFEVALAVPDAAGLAAEARAVSSPSSASFRHFLTAAQFRDRYAPSTADVDAVSAWVRSSGLQVASVASSRLYLEATGTMAQAEALVGTSMHIYSYQGKQLAAPVADYQVSSDVKSKVAGIVDLDDSFALRTPADTEPGPPPGVRYGVEPCSDYYGQQTATDKPPAYGQTWPYTICGYNAKQYQSAFGLSGAIAAGHNGHGVTVAITDAYAAPTILADAQRWSNDNDIPKFAKGQFKQDIPQPDGFDHADLCGPQGWYGEETLDVESVHAMAPGANVLYVGGENCIGGLNRAWASVIDDHKASVITNSWTNNGENVPQGQRTFFDNELQQAATTGITVMFSSGDDGDQSGTIGKSVNFPTSSPWATGIGGTSTEIGANGKIVFQDGWSNAYATLDGNQWKPKPPGPYSSGSGGGTSKLYEQPWYQAGVVPTSISEYNGGKTPMRAVPDISMPGDPNTGLRIGETQVFGKTTRYETYRLGGTSLSSPLFAGVVADAIEYNHGAAVGFINPLVYQNSNEAAITDVQHSSAPEATVRTNYVNNLNDNQGYAYLLQTIGVPTHIFTLPGYDDMTGVGTPNGLFFLKAMKY